LASPAAFPAAHDDPAQTCSSIKSTVTTRCIAQLSPVIIASLFQSPAQRGFATAFAVP